ncbi:HSP90 family protein [Laceyella putida]|uniref:HSP90 family protein n=1 Tax=Laceyella putida TaxID=110101 RepID=A0ABW2RJK1_9BACL
MSDYHFKVNLKGMIDLLSNHLYSTPHVFIRELLQNAVDAITARKQCEPTHDGKVGLEVFAAEGSSPTLYLEDNGIGLTEEEVHQFLAQIGQTSKRSEQEADFIGRFGVGLLSCFIVSEEIVVITRSIKSEETIEWRGRPDGSYRIRKLAQPMSPGTRIYIQSKEGFERYFEPEQVKEFARYYGEFLPYPIFFYGEKAIRLNADQAPWDMNPIDALVYGKEKWNVDFIDAIPLHSPLGDAKGIAYILPHSVNINAKRKHRVYVKQMLLSEKVEKILPDWSFFVTCVLNVNHLKPTVSREEFYDDALLELVKKELGDGIKRYLRQLAKRKSPLLGEIIRVHYSSLKLLALEDDELYALFIDWLPFETSLGTLTMGEIRRRSSAISYTPSVDEFRQISKVAKAQSRCVINGGYMYDLDLIEKLGRVFPGTLVERIDSASFTQGFADLSLEERELAYSFVRLANAVLQPFGCTAEIKKFHPHDLPALYTTSEEGLFLRMAEQTKEEANPLFASIIEQVTTNRVSHEPAQLCFNFENAIIQKVIRVEDAELCRLIVETLYVQALLMGHYPLKPQEMMLLNSGLIRFIERGLDA